MMAGVGIDERALRRSGACFVSIGVLLGGQNLLVCFVGGIALANGMGINRANAWTGLHCRWGSMDQGERGQRTHLTLGKGG